MALEAGRSCPEAGLGARFPEVGPTTCTRNLLNPKLGTRNGSTAPRGLSPSRMAPISDGTLGIYKLGFNQNYYTFALVLLIKIVMCSEMH